MKRSQIQIAYDRYLWEKCSRSTYYKRIRQWMSIDKAIKPINKEERHMKCWIRSDKFKDELEWYYKQDIPKVDRSKFYQRLYKWYSKEEAIKIDFVFTKNFSPRKDKQLYVRKSQVKADKEWDYNEIRIRYTPEEAQVFKKEYIRIIDELEWKWRITEDQIESKNIVKKIDSLKREYQIFIFYQNRDEVIN